MPAVNPNPDIRDDIAERQQMTEADMPIETHQAAALMGNRPALYVPGDIAVKAFEPYLERV